MRSSTSAVLLGLACAVSGATVSEKVLATPSLVAFWDFQETNANGNFVARANVNGAVETGLYPVWLRTGEAIGGGGVGYTTATWPDAQHNVINQNAGGPFGQGLNVDQTTLYATVERANFANTPLDISGRSPFTLMAWVKFPVNSHKHHIAGIWDEGSWDRYSGQRQYALFRTNRYGDRLFGHISATGAASYPQSNASGSEYARIRALNGETLDEGAWRMLAMTYNGDDAQSSQDGVSTVNSYSNGEEWVEESIYPRPQHYTALTNPKAFDWGVFHPRRFIVKFKGYKVAETGVYEHYARVDLKSSQRTIAYGVKAETPGADASGVYQVTYKFTRNGQTVADGEGSFAVTNSAGQAVLPQALQVEDGDKVVLELLRDVPEGVWSVGGAITREIGAGAPFAFGRILGDGTQMTLGGVAMYNRALSAAELATLVENSASTPEPTVATPQPPATPEPTVATPEPATGGCTGGTIKTWGDCTDASLHQCCHGSKKCCGNQNSAACKPNCASGDTDFTS